VLNPLVQAQRIGLALEAVALRRPELLSRAAAIIITLVAIVYGALLATGAPLMVMLVAPMGLIALWLVFTLPAYAALLLLGFRWGFIFDTLDRNIGLQSPSLPLALLLLLVLAWKIVERERRFTFDPIIILLLCYFAHVAFGYWYVVYPQPVTDRLIDFAKDISYTLVVVFWLIKPRVFAGAAWLMVIIGALLATLTIYQEATQTYDENYWGLARVKIAQIVEGVEDRPRAGGSLGEPNYYAQMLTVPLALALWAGMHARKAWGKLFGGYAALAMLIAIGLTYSRGALLAVVAMVAVYFFRFKIRLRYLLYLIPLVLVAALAAPPELRERFGTLNQLVGESDPAEISDDSLANRSRYLIVGTNMFLDSPIIGLGAGHFKALYSDYIQQMGLSPERDQNRNAHNYYLEVLTEHGLIGIGLVLTMMWLALRRINEARRIYTRLGDTRMADLAGFLEVGFAGYAVSAFFLHGDYPRFLWLLLGMAVAFAAGARQLAAEGERATTESPTTTARLGTAEA
jgi:putative inorganic carbon (hco3(-)) transporter